MKCSHPGCTKSIKNHRWGRTKAEGWLLMKNGRAFCPTHIPAWYTKWKIRKDNDNG